jgi:protein involved in polysaccharide export with SLBB domain
MITFYLITSYPGGNGMRYDDSGMWVRLNSTFDIGMSVASFLLLALLLSVGCGGQSRSVTADNEMMGTGLMPPPVFNDFVLGPSDELSIEVFGHKELDRKVRVGPNGEFYYPFLGYVHAEGMTVKELRAYMSDGISKFYVDPEIGISAVGLRSQKIFILGAVTNPGIYPLEQPVTAFEVVLRAGGFNDRAKRSSIMLVRSNGAEPEIHKLDLEQIYEEGIFTDNPYLQGGDILYVPENLLTNIEDFVQHLTVFMRPLLDVERGVILWPEFIDTLQGEARRQQ